MLSNVNSTVAAAASQPLPLRLSSKCSTVPAPRLNTHRHQLMYSSSLSASRTSKNNNMGVPSVGGVDPVTMADSAASLQAAGIDQLPFHFPTDSNWPVWVLGSLATFVIPLATGKLGPLRKLFDKFDAAVDTAQAVADMVDDMAEKVEEMADDIGNSLPAGALKDALDYVENMADQTEKAAEYAESLLNKVEEVGDKVEEFMESAVSNKPMTSTSTTAAMTVSVQQPQESQAEM